jgi:2-dehydropantoate 2-reductase
LAETAVVTAQNGIPWWYFYGFEGQFANLQLQSVDPEGRQWRALGPERAIACTVYPATEILEPGIIKHIYGDRFGLGEPTGKITGPPHASGRGLREGRPEAEGRPEDPGRHLAEALGQPLLQPDLGADPRDARRRRDRSRHRAVARGMMTEAEKIARRIGRISASTWSAGSMARRRWAPTAPRCCRISTRAVRSNSTPC